MIENVIAWLPADIVCEYGRNMDEFAVDDEGFHSLFVEHERIGGLQEGVYINIVATAARQEIQKIAFGFLLACVALQLR